MQRIRARVRVGALRLGKRDHMFSKDPHAVTRRMESLGREGTEDGRHTPALEAVEMAQVRIQGK